MEQRFHGNLTLNISVPLSLATFGEAAYPSRQDGASQLIGELTSHISANLTSPGYVSLLKGDINNSLATNDRAVVATAIERLAAEFAHRLVGEFPSLLARQVAIANGTRPRSEPKMPETAQEIEVYLDNFIDENLAKFYKPGGEFVKDLAKRAASKAQAVSDQVWLLPEHPSGLAKLALYDFVILCGKPPSRSLFWNSSISPLGQWLKLSD